MRIVAYCRGGFEPEAAADLRRAAARASASVDIASTPLQGFTIATTAIVDRGAWHRAFTDAPPVFARSVFTGEGPIAIADADSKARADRVTPLLRAIADTCKPPWRSVWIEYPDTNEGKQLSTLARALTARIQPALRDSLNPDAPSRLRIFLLDGTMAYVGESDARVADWPLGIPRLRMPPGAPSRSTLKLAEAFEVFLADQAADLLCPGMHAVDLGASPGGWTWQLVQRGLRVTAVDNGPLKGSIRDDPLVRHVRDDAFRYRPRRPVDWLVCDVVEQPIRIAELVAQWIGDGLARRTIFNLKLPMKKRYAEIEKCTDRIERIMSASNESYSLRLKQLYHDRQEVTGYLSRNRVN